MESIDFWSKFSILESQNGNSVDNNINDNENNIDNNIIDKNEKNEQDYEVDVNDEKDYKQDVEKQNQYKEKINAIKTYFNISSEAAIYIYYRRKRSFPWKKKYDPKYLFWNAKLQNALIYMDSIIDFEWNSLEFGKESEIMAKYGVELDSQSQDLFRNFEKNKKQKYKDDQGDEWNIVPKKSNHEKILQTLKLLPERKNLW